MKKEIDFEILNKYLKHEYFLKPKMFLKLGTILGISFFKKKGQPRRKSVKETAEKGENKKPIKNKPEPLRRFPKPNS